LFHILCNQTCHQLTEKLVAYTVENGTKLKSQEGMKEIMASAKHISPKWVELLINSLHCIQTTNPGLL
jgi:hypothetical protein